MAVLSKEISQAWEEREDPVIFVTVDQEGLPNAIYASCVSKYDEATLVVADNHFHKTRKNILWGCKASLLFRTKNWKNYQIKGEVEYQTAGEIYEDMKRWNPPNRVGHGAAVIKVKAVFSGSKQLV